MENKEKYAFWLYPKTKKLVESHIKDTACRSQSEFVEDAIRFYCGHLDVNTGEAIGYLVQLHNLVRQPFYTIPQLLLNFYSHIHRCQTLNQDKCILEFTL